jgi:hypothetical protein
VPLWREAWLVEWREGQEGEAWRRRRRRWWVLLLVLFVLSMMVEDVVV